MLIVSCSICLEIFVEKDDLVVLTCGHIFHKQCVIVWLKQHKTCPLCRSKQDARNCLRKLYFNLVNKGECNIQIPNCDTLALNNTISTLQKRNKELVEKNEHILKHQTEQLEKFKVVNSLHLSVSRELETLRFDYSKLKSEISCKREEVESLTKQNEKYKFIDDVIKDLSNEISNKVETILNSDDVLYQLNILATALLITEKNKKSTDELNLKLQQEVNILTRKDQKLRLQITKLRESLAVLQKEDAFNKIQLAEFERFFKMKNANVCSFQNNDMGSEHIDFKENHLKFSEKAKYYTTISETEKQDIYKEQDLLLDQSDLLIESENDYSTFSSTNNDSVFESGRSYNCQDENPFLFKNKQSGLESLSIMRKTCQSNQNIRKKKSIGEIMDSSSMTNKLFAKFQNGQGLVNNNQLNHNQNIINSGAANKKVDKRKLTMPNQASIKNFFRPFDH